MHFNSWSVVLFAVSKNIPIVAFCASLSHVCTSAGFIRDSKQSLNLFRAIPNTNFQSTGKKLVSYVANTRKVYSLGRHISSHISREYHSRALSPKIRKHIIPTVICVCGVIYIHAEKAAKGSQSLLSCSVIYCSL